MMESGLSNKVFKTNGTDEFNKSVLENNRYVFVKIGHDRCPPCNRITQSIMEFEDPYVLLDLDIASHFALNKYSERSYPTWAAVVDGNVVASGTGFGAPVAINSFVDYITQQGSQKPSGAPKLSSYIDTLLNAG